jgi:hypothetical protein
MISSREKEGRAGLFCEMGDETACKRIIDPYRGFVVVHLSSGTDRGGQGRRSFWTISGRGACKRIMRCGRFVSPIGFQFRRMRINLNLGDYRTRSARERGNLSGFRVSGINR